MTIQDAVVAVAVMECSMQVGVASGRGSLINYIIGSCTVRQCRCSTFIIP